MPTSLSPIVAPNKSSFISAWIALFFLIALGTSSAHTFANTGALGTARVNHTATLLHNGLVLVAGGNGIDSAELYDPATGAWSATGSLATARGNHTATVLPNGKILVVGGSSGLASAEIYDPATGTWSATGALATGRFLHSATLLPNGNVLVTGGFNFTDNYLASAELYDPATGTWSATGSMAAARAYHPATLLANGKLLVAGGFDGSSLPGVELYDPALGTWSATGPLASARGFHTSILLPSGQVLVAGGNNGPDLASSELYDPATGTWSATGALAMARREHSVSLLPEGKVLVSGGFTGGATAELYDPVAGTWSATGSLVSSRRDHTSTILPNGKVLVAAGSNGGALTSAEIYDPYDPASGTWSGTGSLNNGFAGHTATLLPDGKVLAAGGDDLSFFPSSAEVYDPATELWMEIGGPPEVAPNHTATLMANGKVLILGGATSSGGPAVSSNRGEVYDPVADSWKFLAPHTGNGMATGRYNHTATLLPNGKVLVVGGIPSLNSQTSSAELFDPSNVSADPDFNPIQGSVGTFSSTGSLATGRYNHTATLLPNGKVLVVGGRQTAGVYLSSAELYDPATGTWSATDSLASARGGHTATLLPNGKVLVAGGDANGPPIAIAELYDPATGTWSTTGSLVTARRYHSATLLPDGRVLVAGGDPDLLSSAEIYDPATGSWSATGALAAVRNAHTATLLPSGKVLVAGGGNDFEPIDTAELYDPGFGFSPASRPQITSVSFDASGSRLVLTGTGFRGVSGASGGNGAQNSPTNYPIVEWRRLDNDQSFYLLTDPAVPVSGTSFTSEDIKELPLGMAMVTVIANGIASEGSFVGQADIHVEQPVNVSVASSDTRDFGIAVFGDAPASLVFTIKNTGAANLTGLTITIDGTNAADFTETVPAAAPVIPGGTTTFTVQFDPATSGPKSAVLHLASNVSAKDPFDINLTGRRLSFTDDTDLDGLNDASEFRMAALGFDWQVGQTALVNLYYDNASEAGLFTSQQVQAIHVGTPLIARDPLTSEFTITFGLKKSTDLMSFSPFPFVAPNTSINGGGNLEFKFTSPDDAAFFLLEAE